MISSKKRWALIHENNDKELDLQSLIKKMKKVDIIFIEGFKNSNLIYPKLEVSRLESEKSYIFKTDENIIAFISDKKTNEIDIPVFDINNIIEIVEFLEKIIHEKN
tara:strand:- start:330 stop:647 length:318 start_codon:yes stop_codon:yes gene_type:complete